MKHTLIAWILAALIIAPETYADIWILDINDTITLRNDVDPEKTAEVTLGQLVAQSTFLKNEPLISIEAHIKRTHKSKSHQRETYKNIRPYALGLLDLEMIADETFDAIPGLFDFFQKHVEVANKPENQGFFPSLFAFVDYILATDPKPCISIQSFGLEIPIVLEVLKDRYSGKLIINDDIGVFDNKDQLIYKGIAYTTAEEMMSLLVPCTVVGWQNNHDAKGRKYLFFHGEGEEEVRSHFHDDNAEKCVQVFRNGVKLSIEESYRFAASYIHKVETGKALTEKDYFIKLHEMANH